MQLLVGTRKGLLTFTRGADGAWSSASIAFLGDPIPMMLTVPDSDSVYAVLGTGHFGSKLHRSDDAGSTWTEIGTPQYPPQPESATDDVPWNLELIWSLASCAPDRPEVLWCGTIPGGLFRSDDAGETWQLNEPLWHCEGRRVWLGGGYNYPGIHSICVDPRDTSKVTVGISIGGVYRSLDDGKSWFTRSEGLRANYVPPQLAHDPDQQDPHLIVQCRDDPDTYWMQHHNGIFVSRNDCETWQEITAVSPSTFGFAVAVHPGNPDQAWFVPADNDERRVPVEGKVVVTRTDDGGKSFSTLNKGLPQDNAFDLVYRHSLDISNDGESLAFGSTTGNLWYSDNGGDDWQTISNHLPPILAVSFRQ